jgi:hypothetical protein
VSCNSPFSSAITSSESLLQAIVSILPQQQQQQQQQHTFPARAHHHAPHLAAKLLFSISHRSTGNTFLLSSTIMLQSIASAAVAIIPSASIQQRDGYQYQYHSPHHTAALLLCCLPSSPPHPSLLSLPHSLVIILIKELPKV